jgi:hypothetical protein
MVPIDVVGVLTAVIVAAGEGRHESRNRLGRRR